MKDVDQRLREAGERWRAGQDRAPEVDQGRLTARRAGQRSGRWIPASAAAAVVVLVGAGVAIGLHEWVPRSARTPIASPGTESSAPSAISAEQAVPWLDVRRGPDDVPAPILPHSGPPRFYCTPDQVAVSSESVGPLTRIVVTLRPGVDACNLPGSPSAVELLDAAGHRLPVELLDAVSTISTNPPGYADVGTALSTARPSAEFDLQWDGGYCGANPARVGVYLYPPSAQIDGKQVQPITGPLTGQSPACAGVTGPVRYLPFTAPGGQAPMPPPQWGQLSAALDLPTTLTPGSALQFAVRLTNAGTQPAPLQPCAAYSLLVSGDVRLGSAAIGGGALLNCRAAPLAIQPGQTITFDMTWPADQNADFTPGATVTIDWAIAGVPTATGTVVAR